MSLPRPAPDYDHQFRLWNLARESRRTLLEYAFLCATTEEIEFIFDCLLPQATEAVRRYYAAMWRDGDATR